VAHLGEQGKKREHIFNITVISEVKGNTEGDLIIFVLVEYRNWDQLLPKKQSKLSKGICRYL
jgi:hypothetical protein